MTTQQKTLLLLRDLEGHANRCLKLREEQVDRPKNNNSKKYLMSMDISSSIMVSS